MLESTSLRIAFVAWSMLCRLRWDDCETAVFITSVAVPLNLLMEPRIARIERPTVSLASPTARYTLRFTYCLPERSVGLSTLIACYILLARRLGHLSMLCQVHHIDLF